VPEALALDPVEFASERVELFIPGENDLGAPFYLKADRLDYGESSAQLEMVRRAIGEGATDRRWPNIECTIPLVVRGDRDISLAQALHELEAKVGLFQRESGNWIRRDFDLGGGFAGSVGCPVHTAALPGLQGWMMANKQVLTDVTLKLLRHPFWYATTELEAAEVKASGVRDLQFEIAEVLGTAPGLIRIRFKNENASAALRGLTCALESRDYSEGPTAELTYEAEALTPKGGATVVEKSGASGGEVVEHASLTAGWLTILDSEIAGVGHMTHVGVRRMKFRVFDPSSEVGHVQLKLEWRPLGQTAWIEDSGVVTAPLVGDWAIVDLGECRPEVAAIGNQRWEWRLLAKASGGSGTIRIDRVRIEPVEQFLEVSTPQTNQAPEIQSTKSPTAVEDDASTGEKKWENVGNAKASDNTYATCELAKYEVSHWLKTTGFGFTLPTTALIAGIVVSVERQGSAAFAIEDWGVSLVKGGAIGWSWHLSTERWPTSDAAKIYGTSHDLWGQEWSASDINASNFGVAVAAQSVNAAAVAKVDAVTITVYYTEGPEDNRVCFATRSVEISSYGIYRQHLTDEIWGRLIPEGGGFSLYAPPSGLEGRPLRGLLSPSRGDLGTIADSGANSGLVEVSYRPAYLYAREAA